MVGQSKDLVGELRRLRDEYHALRLRVLHPIPKYIISYSLIDTGLLELLVLKTRSELFRKSQKVQESASTPSQSPLVISLSQRL
jgi:hypothetical protein